MVVRTMEFKVDYLTIGMAELYYFQDIGFGEAIRYSYYIVSTYTVVLLLMFPESHTRKPPSNLLIGLSLNEEELRMVDRKSVV